MLALFNAVVCAETLVLRFDMWLLILPAMVSALSLSETLSSVVRPANLLKEV